MTSGRNYYTYDDLKVSIPVKGLFDAIDRVSGIDVRYDERIEVDIEDTDIELRIPVELDLIRETDGGERGERWETYEMEVNKAILTKEIQKEIYEARVVGDLMINEVEER